MYNPIGGSDYEFIELYNNGPKTLDLTHLKMVEDETIRFDFAQSQITSLAIHLSHGDRWIASSLRSSQ